MQIVWNRQAKSDVLEIKAYYEDFGAGIGQRLAEGIISAVDRLEAFPESGRIVPEINDPDFREVLWKDWRIIYLLPEANDQPLEILNVLHSAQQFGGRS